MRIERSSLSGEIREVKTIEINGMPIGVVSGYIATWQPDHYRGIYGVPDRILKGAYTASLQEHKARKNRQIRLKDNHGRVIGGFPIETAREDNVGLYAEGHINLNTQLGREVHSLAMQRVLVDFSVGHMVKKDRIENNERLIMEADIYEGSITEEPKNRWANVTEVKSMRFPDLPIVSGEYSWNEDDARARVMDLKFADGNGADAFVGEHLIADVVNGKLMVIPAALQIAADEVKQSGDQAAQQLLERYFSKMEIKSPFDTKLFYSLDDVRNWTQTEFKDALISTGMFSNGAARALVAKYVEQKGSAQGDSAAYASIMADIQSAIDRAKR